jgi:hypothetical protein
VSQAAEEGAPRLFAENVTVGLAPLVHRPAGQPYEATRSLSSSMPLRSSPAELIERAYVDKGYRSHDTANPHRVFVSGQKRGAPSASSSANYAAARTF